MDCPSDPDEILILPEVKVETPSVHLATQQIVDFSNFEEVQIKEEFIIDDQQHQTDLLHLPKQKKDVNLDITEVKTDLQKNQEYSSLTTNLSDSQNNEEFELSRDIENETETDQRTQDHQSELLGTGFRFVDVTDIVNEFKSENQTSQETKNQLPKDSDSGLLNKIKTEEQAENKKELFQYTGRVDEKYMLHYCDACKKSWKYVSTYSPCSVCHKMSKYMCSRCLKPYKRLNSLRMHLDYLCRGKFIPCEYCRHKAISLSALRQHIEEEHLSDNSDSSNECEKCGETFSWRRELLRHEKLCDQLRASYKLEKLTCDDCGYVTTDKFNLAYHILRVHYLNNTNLNKCNICDKVSMRRGDLLKHYKRCGQFSCYHFCNQCEFKTVYVQNLRKHKINKHS